jgi:hypothetical protein
MFKPWNAVLAVVLIGCGGAEALAAGQHGRAGVLAGPVGQHHGQYHGVAGEMRRPALRGQARGHAVRGHSTFAHPFAHRRHSFGGGGGGYYPDADGASYAQAYAALYIYALAAAESAAAAPPALATNTCAALHERIKTSKGWQWRTHYDACGRSSPPRTGHFR